MCEQITYNSKVHDLIAPLYEARHGEIFNQTEQQRIRDLLEYAIKCIKTGAEVPNVLDFGAGTGNLTRHLLDIGVAVVSSDVSAGCLRELKSSSMESRLLELSLLNGNDLSQFADESFDMVATYSVLHHVPDYLAIVSEFVRVLKPGGILYIDHEVGPDYWQDKPEYQAYCHDVAESQQTLPSTILQKIAHVLRQTNCLNYLSSALKVSWNRVSDEGDIHVHADDHIEWIKIRSCLESQCEILREQDYLVCREQAFPAPAWEKWRSRCVDMRLIVAEKH